MTYLIMRYNRHQIATFIAIIFHLVGLAGIMYFKSNWIIQSPPFNLLLMLALLIWTQDNKNTHFYLLIGTVFIIGLAIEITGVNTGILFGNYSYGDKLGPLIYGVPWIIGLNWFIIIYCCGITIHTVIAQLLTTTAAVNSKKIKALSIIIDSATLAAFFDWVMEPVANRLGYWTWGGAGNIPIYNYVCWFIISAGLIALFQLFPIHKKNKFAVHLLLIQLMFFLLLRVFL